MTMHNSRWEEAFDRGMATRLRHWAAHQHPPVSLRARLLYRARLRAGKEGAGMRWVSSLDQPSPLDLGLANTRVRFAGIMAPQWEFCLASLRWVC
jgi:uncharacterized protein (DUF2237 family)